MSVSSLYTNMFLSAWSLLPMSVTCPRAWSESFLRGIYQKASLPDHPVLLFQRYFPGILLSFKRLFIQILYSHQSVFLPSSLWPQPATLRMTQLTADWENAKVTPVEVLFCVGPWCLIYLMDFHVWTMGIISGACRTCKQPIPVEGRLRKQ